MSNQYRLKSLKNGNEWVVREQDIDPIQADAQSTVVPTIDRDLS
jgi:hypothetical protein